MLHLKKAKNLVNIFLKTYQIIYNNVKNSHIWTSKATRLQFLDYFIKENNHKYIRSSPVVPFCDPTVAFVNAGMNQFKGVFLGRQEPIYPRVANSQKCVRVGGKHNDLNVVGTDGYHHTFFEMLGNWSFGDYFKKEACELAWKLLTGPYKLPSSALYVTYFGGDKYLQLEPDLECKEIWLSLGVPDDHIIPFGLKDNFWEMGTSGPCGPCTEIHIDHTMSTLNRRSHVNKDLPDLTELWNIVFIQYNRDENGKISLLPKTHIDTGMGLERLTAILQKKDSNYDTDVFSGLFKIIKKNCPSLPEYESKFGVDDTKGLNTAYRILTDHARTVTVCLADGMIPEQNQKLRRILRKCLHLSETVFKNEYKLLNDLSYGVAENLGEFFPEIHKNMKQIQDIITFEQEIYKQIRETASKDWAIILQTEPRLKKLNITEMPGLIAAFNDLYYSGVDSITPEFAFRMYDTHGLDLETITQFAQVLELPFESESLKKELEATRSKTKENYLYNSELIKMTEVLKIPKTDDGSKYKYRKDKNYIFKNIEVTVLKIIKNNEFVNQINENDECYLILDKTNLYTEAGGQFSDTGIIKFNQTEFKITDVLNINGYIFHKGSINTENIKLGDQGILSVDKEHRLKLMCNHTATHLLNAAIKNILKVTTCQKSSTVKEKELNFDVGIYGKKLTVTDIENIENFVRKIIKNQNNVETKLINSQELLGLDNVTLIPGEVYPEEGIRLINITDKNLNLTSW